METRKPIMHIFVLAIFPLLVTSAQMHKISEKDIFSFIAVKGNIPTAEVMKIIAEKYADDIKYGLNQAGISDSYLPFIEQLRLGNYVRKSIPIGDQFIWMMFRDRGKVKVLENIEWDGEAPLDVISFDVLKDNRLFEFIMPRSYGFIALHKVGVARPPVICNLNVSPRNANIDEPIVIDMSLTKNATRMTVDIFNAQGIKIQSHSFTGSSPVWQTTLNLRGKYIIKASAANDDFVSDCHVEVTVPEYPIISTVLPEPSDMISKDIKQTLFNNLTYNDINRFIYEDLKRNGFSKLNYFNVVNNNGEYIGYALVTTLDQIEKDGSNKPSEDRGSTNIAPLRKLTWEYLYSIFSPIKGYYRFYVFAVTRGVILTSRGRDVFINNNYNMFFPDYTVHELNSEIGSSSIPKDSKLLVYVYEFEKKTDSENPTKTNRLTIREHLVKSGLSDISKIAD